jgi:hypothetical protein
MSSRRISGIAVIRDAYSFTFSNLGGIVGLVWLPTLLLVVMGFFSSQHFWTDVIAVTSCAPPASRGASFLVWVGYLVSSLLLQSVAFVAVVQLALGSRSGPVIAHFAFGALEWRMFSALMSFTVFMLAVFLVGGTLVSAAAATMAPAAALLTLALLAVMLVLMARMFLLLPAIAVVDTGPVLRRVWQVTAGNFLRLFGVLLAIIIPLFVLAMLLLSPATAMVPPPMVDMDHLQQQQLAMARWEREMLPYVWGLLFFLSPLAVGLFSGAGVSAWRALKDEPQTEIIA